jgi:hypothetical protein
LRAWPVFLPEAALPFFSGISKEWMLMFKTLPNCQLKNKCLNMTEAVHPSRVIGMDVLF